MIWRFLCSTAAALAVSAATGQQPTCSGGPGDEGSRPQATVTWEGERDDGGVAERGGFSGFIVIDDLEASPPSRDPQPSICDRLAAFDSAEQANAMIAPELATEASAAARATAWEAAGLWNTGEFGAALAGLRALESVGLLRSVAIDWRVARDGGPQPRTGGIDRRVPHATDVKQCTLDFDHITGNLFCVYSCYSNEWWISRSMDGGATWQNPAGVLASSTPRDIDAAVVDEFVYVGVVWDSSGLSVSLRRMLAATGNHDGVYGAETIAPSAPATISELALASNADSFQSRIYVATLQSDGAIRFFWDISTDGKSFTEASPAGVNAATGLDMTWNPDYTSRFLFMSYLGADDAVHVLRTDSPTPTWDDLVVQSDFSGTKPITTLSAYGDAVFCSYSHRFADGIGVQYRVSYDAGDTWNVGDIFRPTGTEGSYSMFDSTARGGVGTAATAQQEVGEPDPVLFKRRGGYAPGLWDDAAAFNDHDVTTGSWLAMSWLPPRTTTPRSYSYGAVYITGGGTPYFDRINHCGGDLNGSGAIDLQDLAQLLAHFGMAEADYADGDITGDGSVGLTDLAILLSVFGVNCP